ncbi:unnamed protein product [Hermetia illucens]|uniref:G-protein coupled receptors family 1 profile domain-containing protein n=2 Tax=Hermetia illucens TaxID=343691 RepID=A0A7R8UYR1_HERIL|nr:unnamed protein product [Hermetia illucens]
MRPKMTPSAFTYLAALSWLDCASCGIICVTSLTQTLFYDNNFWIQCDIELQNPIFGLTTGAANLCLVFVTLDRLVYLKNGLPQTVPKFCTKGVARVIVACVLMVAIFLNVPYFFIFEHKDGNFYTTTFYHSDLYVIYNWVNFFVVSIFPVVFLMIGNTIMILVVRKWANSPCIQKSGIRCADKRRYKYQMKLVATLIAIICLFYIGDIPAHLVSRKSAIVLLFAGDLTKNDSSLMATVRMVVAVLNAFQLSVNIIVYALINPIFLLELVNCMRATILAVQRIVATRQCLKCFKTSDHQVELNLNALKLKTTKCQEKEKDASANSTSTISDNFV